MAMSTFTVRPLEEKDFDKGYMELLMTFTTVGQPSREDVQQRFHELQQNPDVSIQVIEEDGVVLATGTLLVERKFIHSCGKTGHVEDVVVHPSWRGKGLGKRLVETLIESAKQQGCYKVILDCGEWNTEFYEKCGMRKKEVMMAKYFEEEG